MSLSGNDLLEYLAFTPSGQARMAQFMKTANSLAGFLENRFAVTNANGVRESFTVDSAADMVVQQLGGEVKKSRADTLIMGAVSILRKQDKLDLDINPKRSPDNSATFMLYKFKKSSVGLGE